MPYHHSVPTSHNLFEQPGEAFDIPFNKPIRFGFGEAVVVVAGYYESGAITRVASGRSFTFILPRTKVLEPKRLYISFPFDEYFILTFLGPPVLLRRSQVSLERWTRPLLPQASMRDATFIV